MMYPRAFKQYTPSLNRPCLCGSGKKFKRCCADRYQGRRPGELPRAAITEGDFEKALNECRADITQYTVWHKSHTEPILQEGVPDERLLNIDLLAMAELVELLLYCYKKVDRLGEFHEVLERLRNNIRHENWQRKIVYFHALCALEPDWNEHAGRRELRRLGSVEKENDPKILQLYIDLFGEQLSFSKKIGLIERTIEVSDKQIDILHYRSLRAIQFLLHGDDEEASKSLETAINEFQNRSTKELDLYEKARFAESLQLLGEIRGDDTVLDQALKVLREVSGDEELTNEGQANIHRNIGDIHRHKNEWEKALDS